MMSGAHIVIWCYIVLSCAVTDRVCKCMPTHQQVIYGVDGRNFMNIQIHDRSPCLCRKKAGVRQTLASSGGFRAGHRFWPSQICHWWEAQDLLRVHAGQHQLRIRLYDLRNSGILCARNGWDPKLYHVAIGCHTQT